MISENDTLPIVVNERMRMNGHIMTGLAQQAFRLANYDMTPEDSVAEAIRKGLIIVAPETNLEGVRPIPIRRMPGNGSFA